MNNEHNENIGAAKDNDGLDSLLGKLIFGKYRLIKKIGEGTFGKIYKAEYQNKFYAIKLESKIKGNELLETESMILTYLKGPKLPTTYSYGYSGDHNLLVMELLGQSLDELIEIRRRFSVKTVAMVGFQMISILEYIHDKHVIHRDIKPDNFVLGLNNNSQYIYLIDFGLAKKYRSSKTLIHNPLINKSKLTGTARYASINALKGFEQSRRDDLESIAYVLLYLLRGHLPWQGIHAKNKDERYHKIMEKKELTSPRELCLGYPKQFERLVEYTRNLEYTEDPDYEMLHNVMSSIVTSLKWKFDYIYDWSTKEEIAYLTNENKDFLPKQLPFLNQLSKQDKSSYRKNKGNKQSSKEDGNLNKTTRTNSKTHRTTDKAESNCCLVF